MPRAWRHLHELTPGDEFRFSSKSETFRLVELGPGRCTIQGTGHSRKVRIGDREFTATTTGLRPCAPGAMVRPIT
jgi:hypothetical protein